MIIDIFNNEFGFLSNFHYAPLTYCGIRYRSSESAYQAHKTTDVEKHHLFSSMTARDSKNAGRKLTLRDDWDDVKLDVMYEILLCKFTQHHDLKQKLLSTGDAEIIEGNNWGDSFWGVCKGVGTNHLGKTLMRIREELNDER